MRSFTENRVATGPRPTPEQRVSATSFFRRIFLGHLVVIVLSTVVIGFFVVQQSRAQVFEGAKQELTTAAEMLRTEIATAPGDFQNLVRRLGTGSRIRLTVVAADGRVLGDSEVDPETMENHKERPEIRKALANGALAVDLRTSQSTHYPTMYLALVGIHPSLGRMCLRTAIPMQELELRTQEVVIILCGALGLATGLALVMAWFLARSVSRPVHGLIARAQALRRGEALPPPMVLPKGEMGDLVAAFDGLVQEVDTQLTAVDQARSNLEAILGSMVEGVIAVDANLCLVHCNASAQVFLGLETTPAQGVKIQDVCSVASLREILEAAVAGEGSTTRTVKLLRDHQDRFFELHADAVRGPAGENRGAVVVIHDTTTIRRLEGIRKDFVANISHELKTPLTTIIGMVATILDDEEMNPAQQRRFLERVAFQSERLDTLIRDLLTLSRLESDQDPLSFAPLDLCSLAQVCLQDNRDLAQQRGQELTVILPKEAIRIEGDRESLRQAIDNLLSNALKYTSPGGKIELNINPGPRNVSISVKDNGPGIPAIEQDRIFQRFYRIDKARSRELGGTGLGLSIVKHVVLAHHGRVILESAEGKGSIFTLVLPLTQLAESGKREQIAVEEEESSA